MSEMTIVELQKQVDDGLKVLKQDLNNATAEIEKSIIGKLSDTTKEQLNNTMKELDVKMKALQDHTDKVDAELQKFTKGGLNVEGSVKNFTTEFQKYLQIDGKSFATSFKDSNRKFEFEMKGVSGRDLALINKAVGTMTTAASVGSGVIRAERVPSVLEIARYMGHARELFNQYPTSSPTVEQVKEVVGEGDLAPQTEGAAKAQIDRDFSLVSTPIQTLAGFVRISVQLLEDLPLLNSFLPEMLRREMAELEDAQFIYGNGTSPNISGITDSGNYTAFTAFGPADSSAQLMDLLMAVCTQIEVANHTPNGILLHPYEWLQLFNLKDSTNNYLRGVSFDQSTGLLNILGVPVIKAKYLTAGDYIVGDWSRGAEIYDKTGMDIRFFEQDADNVTKNLVTIRCEERTGLFVKYPASFVYGTATTDIAKIVNWS